MKIQTLSVVVGDNSCNAHCPFCISRITGKMANKSEEVNWRNFRIACKLAEQSGATTVLLTGKGEPTLHPGLIYNYICRLTATYNFPFIELQTNGINLADPNYNCDEHIKNKMLGQDDWPTIWYETGLTTICLSAVHYKREWNQEIYGQDYPDLQILINSLHEIGYTVRLSVMLMKNFIDSIGEFNELSEFCRKNKIAQLTVRPIDSPSERHGEEVTFVTEHTLGNEWQEIKNFVNKTAIPILNLAHGATVYDMNGQNVCLATCLTTNKTEDDIRQLIFFPNGELRYDWTHKGAILLKGRE